MQTTTGKVFQVFYSKDVKKKKKVYSQGILLCQFKRTKLFNQQGECLLSLPQTNQPQPNQEYTINFTYLVTIDREIPMEQFQSGKVFMQQNLPTPALPPKKQVKQSLQKIELEIAKTFQNGLQIQTFLFKQLRPHQIEGVNFMYECLMGKKGNSIEGCILADFMGLGKTLQTLTLIRCLVIQKAANKIVVVCPLTLLKTWERESIRWMGNKLTPLVSLGSSEEISKIIRMFVEYDYRMLVTSYQQFAKHSQQLSKKCDMLIFDEGHRLKNKKGKLFQKIRSFKCRKRVLLTGTPLQNNLDELYTCIAIVNPSFMQSQNAFKNIFQKPILAGMAKNASKEQRSLAISRTRQLAGRIKEFSLRRKADVLQNYLPAKRQYQIFFGLTPLQLTIYERFMKVKHDIDVLVFVNMMRKLFTHPILFKNDRFQKQHWTECFEDCRQQTSPKIQFVKSVVLQCKKLNQKVVIVSYFTQTLDFIANILKEEEISFGQLDGRLEGQQRHKVVDQFVKWKQVLLLSGKAGGTGLNLTCANRMIMIEPDWNPSNDSQVMGRIWRQGQTKEVEIYRLLIGCSFEQKILQRQQLKQSLSQKLIDEQKNNSSYDFLTMRQLLIEHVPKCITYSTQQNRMEQCIKDKYWGNWRQAIHVQIKESHQGKKVMQNEFQQARFDVDQGNSQESWDQIEKEECEKEIFKQNDQTQEQLKRPIDDVDCTKQSNEAINHQIKGPIYSSKLSSDQAQNVIPESFRFNQLKKSEESLKKENNKQAQQNQVMPSPNQLKFLPAALRKIKKHLPSSND